MPIEQLSLLDLQPEPEPQTEPFKIPEAVLAKPTPPAPPPVTPADEAPLEPFRMGVKVIVAGIDGDFVGSVYHDDGGRYVWVEQNNVALAYERDQVRRQPQPGEKTEEHLKLLAFEKELRAMQLRDRPKVDCFACQHHRVYEPHPDSLYKCAIGHFPGPCSTYAPYGLHIGCARFQAKEITE